VSRRQRRKQREAGSTQFALGCSVREGPALCAGGTRSAQHDELPWDEIHAPGGARTRSISDASPASERNRESRVRARSNALDAIPWAEVALGSPARALAPDARQSPAQPRHRRAGDAYPSTPRERSEPGHSSANRVLLATRVARAARTARPSTGRGPRRRSDEAREGPGAHVQAPEPAAPCTRGTRARGLTPVRRRAGSRGD
jgi:hypothetical protein